MSDVRICGMRERCEMRGAMSDVRRAMCVVHAPLDDTFRRSPKNDVVAIQPCKFLHAVNNGACGHATSARAQEPAAARYSARLSPHAVCGVVHGGSVLVGVLRGVLRCTARCMYCPVSLCL